LQCKIGGGKIGKGSTRRLRARWRAHKKKTAVSVYLHKLKRKVQFPLVSALYPYFAAVLLYSIAVQCK